MTEMQQYQPLFTILKDIIRRAVLTLAVLPDREEGWLSYRSSWPEFARDINEAYGYSAPRARRFRPTAKDVAQLDVVLPWLSFIKREESSFAVRRICAWAFGAPLWRIGQWDNCSADTVMRRIDRSVWWPTRICPSLVPSRLSFC